MKIERTMFASNSAGDAIYYCWHGLACSGGWLVYGPGRVGSSRIELDRSVGWTIG